MIVMVLPEQLKITATLDTKTILASSEVREAIEDAKQQEHSAVAKEIAGLTKEKDALEQKLHFLMTGSEQPADVMERFQRVAGRRGEHVWRGSLENGAWEYSPLNTSVGAAPLMPGGL